MPCLPRRTLSRDSSPPFSIVCSVSDALSATNGGEVRVHIDERAALPVQIDWLRNGATALLELSPDRRRAIQIPPGVYEIVVTDRLQREAVCTVTVQLLDIPAVIGYDVTHATSDFARDGFIRVRTRNAGAPRFLWSNGVITTTPELYDVQPGVYLAAPLLEKDDPVFTHECRPAIVHPSRNTDALFL